MKKMIYLVGITLLSALVLSSCSKDEDTEISYNKDLLIGKWLGYGVNNTETEYYRYDANGSGETWDTSDDVHEGEGTNFTWTLDASLLTQIYILKTDSSGVPEAYTVTQLTSNSLVYKDDFGKSFSFKKVTE